MRIATVERNVKDLEDRNLLLDKSLKLEKIMNEKMSKRRKNKPVGKGKRRLKL